MRPNVKLIRAAALSTIAGLVLGLALLFGARAAQARRQPCTTSASAPAQAADA